MKNFLRLYRKCVVLHFVICISFVHAQNPIVPPGIYIADPSAHVWKDGKIYVYGSRDESPRYYCSWSYQVLSSMDLQTWTLSKQSFASKGSNDQVNYSDDFLYAPDVQFRNNTYYLYYCLSNSTKTEGVATSSSPNGPFVRGLNIDLNGKNQIDPCVFIDDDGQGYYVWGQFNAKIAKLKSNMTEIDTSTIRDEILTEKEHHFHEGGYIIKRNGLYYFIYADISRANMPTCIGYATSKSPMGPYTYRGVIIDNSHCDPGNWNNHGSLVRFNEKWYVFYHRSTNGSNTMRKTCIEPISFRKDGTIPEVEMTSQGATGPLDAFKSIDAGRACLLMGNIRIQSDSLNNETLAEIKNNDRAAYKYIDFKMGADSIEVRVKPGKLSSQISIIIDNPWGNTVGKIDVPGNDTDDWMTIKTMLKPVKGVHALWFRFSGRGDNLCKLDQFKFVSKLH